jgi:hypothetical protein
VIIGFALDKLVLGKPEYGGGRSISVLFTCPARLMVTLRRLSCFLFLKFPGEDSLLLELWLIKGCALVVRVWEVGKS